MKALLKLLLLLPILLTSCMHATADRVTALGGKGAYKSKTFTVVWSNEKSFRDAALAATTIAAAAYSASTAAANATTDQVVAKTSAATAQKKVAADAAVKTTQITSDAKTAQMALELSAAPKP